jgi:hypothetical protein
MKVSWAGLLPEETLNPKWPVRIFVPSEAVIRSASPQQLTETPGQHASISLHPVDQAC